MTTTAFDDQFVSATETILALNVRDECQQVHDLQVRLAAAIQRATDAEAEMAKLREQAPAGWVDADGDFYHGRNYPNVFPTAVPVYAATVPAPAVPELDPMTRLIVSDPKQLKPKKQEPAVPSVVFMAHNKTSSILFAARKDADQYAASFGPAAGVSVTECAVIGSQSAPQAPAVPEEWRDVMQDAHDTFQRYADQHRAKDTRDSHEKANVNQKLANRLYALLQSAEVTK